MNTSALERVVQRGAAQLPAGGTRCGLCAQVVGDDDHRHLLDTADGELLCACYPCSVLFDRPAASRGRYRLVPRRRIPLAGVAPARLGAPVGLAFFLTGADGRVEARYPSPAGATRWEVDREAWERVLADCPPLASLAPDVEALLVNTVRQRSVAWLVPVDDCYRLVGIVRRNWRGLSGGDRVWPEVEQFFAQLAPS